MFVVDVTNIANVKLEDEAILLGKTSNQEITAEDIAQKTSTINYEITTKISPLLPRIVV
jgi:alanine racemase